MLGARLEAKGKTEKGLATLGIETVGELIEHLPHAHHDRGDARTIASVEVGEEASVAVGVRSVTVKPMRDRRRKRVEARVFDDTGPMVAIWWNRPWVATEFGEGSQVLLHGKMKKRNEFHVDDHEVMGAADGAVGHSAGLVPVHPATYGLSAATLRRMLWSSYGLIRHAVEPLPTALRLAERLPDRPAALAGAHFPDTEEDEAEARRRLAFEELFLSQVALSGRRRARREGRRAQALSAGGELVGRWLSSLPFEPTGDQNRASEAIDRDLASEHPMQRLLMGEVGSGKAQPLDALVLTPEGFRRMGDLAVGSTVLTPCGVETTVVGMFPQGVRDVFRVTFADGTSAECDAEHLWQVRTSASRHRGDPPKVKPLREITTDLRRPNGSTKWHVELPVATEFDRGLARPLEPYLLGLLLGDGNLARRDRVCFTTADEELRLAVRERLPRGCVMRQSRSRPYDWYITNAPRSEPRAALQRVRQDSSASLVRAYRAGASCDTIAPYANMTGGLVRTRLLEAGVRLRSSHREPSPLASGLASLGLVGKNARTKAVPEAYLSAPIWVRHAVLQGLMDTDGTLNSSTGSNVTFTSASRQLAEDVAWLVRSLGGRARCWPRKKVEGTYWQTSLALPARFPPFRLRRKAELLRPRAKYARPAKAIVDVQAVGSRPVQCIAVAHPSQLYVTNDFTATHNTLVALHAMLRAVENGRQAALMAPTETLAEQHLVTLDRLLGGIASVELLTGSTPAGRRRELLGRLQSGELPLVVGTHALIEEPVHFRDLALCVVDEQHRFGVRQRAALDAKAREGLAPHVLHMTATPIPRTLSLTAYGDLDATVLRELPAGRRPVETFVVDGARARARAYARIREEIAAGRQCFVVCPLVAKSEALQARAATVEAERLATSEFAEQRVGLIHGQMPSADKAEAMRAFAAGETDVLVATSVIEVGIDVPNATVMLIEAAERYGLSQLHQLRGRVGRGEHASLCILFGDPRLPRLAAIASERDGFRLAEVDLGLRGAGEVLGVRQSGLPEFRVARLPEDEEVLERARAHADALLAADPQLARPEHALLRDAVLERFGSDLVPIPA